MDISSNMNFMLIAALIFFALCILLGIILVIKVVYFTDEEQLNQSYDEIGHGMPFFV